MVSEFAAVFAALRPVLAAHSERLAVKTDSPGLYLVVTRTKSPFPQHKGQPLEFGKVRSGKAYVSFHLMPLYMDAALAGRISAGLKKHMQGKTCFNFRSVPGEDEIAALTDLTAAAVRSWEKWNWL